MRNSPIRASDKKASLGTFSKATKTLWATVALAVASQVWAQTPTVASPSAPTAVASASVTTPWVIIESFSYPVKVDTTEYAKEESIPLLPYIKNPEGVITLNVRTLSDLKVVDPANEAKLKEAKKAIFMEFVESHFGKEWPRYYYSTDPSVIHNMFKWYGKLFVETNTYGTRDDYTVIISPQEIAPSSEIANLARSSRRAWEISVQKDAPKALKAAREYGRKQGMRVWAWAVAWSIWALSLMAVGWRRWKNKKTVAPEKTMRDFLDEMRNMLSSIGIDNVAFHEQPDKSRDSWFINFKWYSVKFLVSKTGNFSVGIDYNTVDSSGNIVPMNKYIPLVTSLENIQKALEWLSPKNVDPDAILPWDADRGIFSLGAVPELPERTDQVYAGIPIMRAAESPLTRIDAEMDKGDFDTVLDLIESALREDAHTLDVQEQLLLKQIQATHELEKKNPLLVRISSTALIEKFRDIYVFLKDDQEKIIQAIELHNSVKDKGRDQPGAEIDR
jgi:hypothetical protein